MGLFERSEAGNANKIGPRARHLDEDVHCADLKLNSTDGETATIDPSLDTTRHLLLDRPNAHGACAPALLGQMQVDRITSPFRVRS